MPVSLFDYLTLRRPPVGRIVFALGKLRLIAVEAKEPGLLALVDAAEKQGRHTLALQREWETVKATRSKARGSAATLDIEFDQSWVALNAMLKGQSLGSLDKHVSEAATMLLTKVFPRGVGALTQQSFELQLAESESILEDLRTVYAPQVQLLGLGRHVAAIGDVARRFRVELQKEEKRLTWDEVFAGQTRAQELYAGVVFNILGRYPTDDPACVARRTELLAEVNRQDKLLLDLYRRRHPTLDVNPDTGDVVDQPIPAEEDAA